MKSSLALFIGATLFSFTNAALAGGTTEPDYCNPKVFYSKEIKTNNSKLERAHMYQLGQTKVMGVGVGDSKAQDLVNMASQQSTATASDKYCTWYFNEGNSQAESLFTHKYVPNPSGLSPATAAKKYNEALKDEFANSVPSFLSCAQNHKYIAMGCNGQKHRGPGVFGMMLAFSGCSPQNAATIVNTVWGLNGVDAATRLAIIAEGQKLGDADPEARARLQQAFGAE
ncbi:hypothetical protein CIK05_06030 [Bdellovibrio sp. qaytius]|nr:hypothetical protein CIK05_06030 [Bdellovibrio sp. qaytius]